MSAERRIAIALCAAFTLTGCEKLVGLLAPNPGDFLNSWTAKQREIEARKWPSMRGPPVLSRLYPGTTADDVAPDKPYDVTADAREAPLSRCVGQADAALLRCISTLGRLTQANIPVFDACALDREGDMSGILECAELAYTRTGEPAALAACRRRFSGDGFSCLVSLSRPLFSGDAVAAQSNTQTSVQANVLSELALWMRRDDFRQDAPALSASLARAESRGNTPGQSVAQLDALNQRNGTAALPGSTGDAGAELLDAAARKILCDDSFSADPESACHAAIVDTIPPEGFTLTREAARLCTLKEGRPKDDTLSVNCLRAASMRTQTLSHLAPCAVAFVATHPGYLAFVKNCVAGAGFRRFDANEREKIAVALADAPKQSLGSRVRLLESYEEIRRKVREEVSLVEEGL